MWTIAIIVFLSMIAGAAWGWRRGTRNIANPPDWHKYPGGMSRRRHLSILSRQHKRRRLPLTIGAAVVSGAFTFSVLLAVAAMYDPAAWGPPDISDRRKKSR
jgi:hypothetical protein